MAVIIEPHLRRDDCDLCRDEWRFYYCGPCECPHTSHVNGHHDHDARPLDRCTRCGGPMKTVPVVDGVPAWPLPTAVVAPNPREGLLRRKRK